MDKKDKQDKQNKIHAEDLLVKLQKHIATPEIPEERADDQADSDEKAGESKPLTLEELFGHTFIDRKSSRASQKSLVKPQKQKRPEKKEETADRTKAKIDETDYNLMTIFGMEGNDDSESEQISEAGKAEQAKPAEQYEPDAYDALTAEDKKRIIANYRKGLRSRALRLLLLLLLGIAVLIWETAALLGATLPAFLNTAAYPVTTGWLAIQVMVFSAVLVSGTLHAFRKGKGEKRRASPEMIFLALLIVHTLYLIVRIVAFSGNTMVTYCLPVMLSAVYCELYHYYEWKREYRTFRIAFSSKYKYTLRESKDDSAKSEREALGDCMPEDSRYFMVERVKNVESFHRLFNAEGPVKRPIKFILPLAFMMALCLGVIIFATSHSAETAFSAAMGVFAMIMPVSLLYVFYAPMASLSDLAYHQNAAVVGEGAMEEYAPPAAVVFTDADLFAPEDIQLVGVKVYENADLSKVLGYASAIFCETGGALGEMFASIVEATGYTADMDFITVDDDGLRAAVNGELVLVGNLEYMKQGGITVPFDSRNFDSENSIMYLAIGRRLAAKMEIAYEIDRDFESVAKNIFRSGMGVAIKTFDPNISRSMLEAHIRWGGDMPLKIVRGKDKNDRIVLKESAPGWIVSSTRRGLFETVKLCGVTRHLMQTGVVLAALSMLVSIPVLWLILKFAGASYINTVTATIYQAIWLLPAISLTKLFG